MLGPLRCDMRYVLEVGIGSVNGNVPSTMQAVQTSAGWRKLFGAERDIGSRSYRPGASLRAWRDVFPFAQIVGLDVDRGALVAGPRLQTNVCNTLNTSAVQHVLAQRLGSFDLIIDDGLHTPL